MKIQRKKLGIICGLIAYSLLILSPYVSSSVASSSNSMAQEAKLTYFSPLLQDFTSGVSYQCQNKDMLKLERLTLAMAEHEGWQNGLTHANGIGSASFRRNNPGNLRASPFAVGKQDNFAVFNTEADGWAAFRWDIRQKAIGNTTTGLNGKSTLKDLVYKWAPASDGNVPEQYLIAVEKMTGFPRTMTLTELIN